MYACSWVRGQCGGVKRTRDQEEEGASEKEGNKSNEVVARRVEACRAGGVWLVRPVATKRKSDRVAGVGRLLTTVGMQERRKIKAYTPVLSSYTRGADVMMRSKERGTKKERSGVESDEHPSCMYFLCLVFACLVPPPGPCQHLVHLAKTVYEVL